MNQDQNGSNQRRLSGLYMYNQGTFCPAMLLKFLAYEGKPMLYVPYNHQGLGPEFVTDDNIYHHQTAVLTQPLLGVLYSMSDML